MRARQLEVFRTVMRAGTVTAAARALNVSQPALSQILLHTEDELGLRLFDRVRGRLVPTPEAEELFPEAERLFGDLESLRRLARDLRDGRAGSVRIAASAPPSLSFLPVALRAFRAAHPGVRTLSYVVPVEGMVEMLERGQAGLGLAMNDERLPGIETETIGHSALVCVLPAAHRLAGRDVLGMAELAGETVISYRDTALPGMLLERALAREGARLRPDIEIDSSIVALGFVQQGLGVAVVDGLVPWGGFAGLVARPFVPEVRLPLCLLTSTRRPLSRGHDRLRAELRAAVRAYAAGARGVLHPLP